MAPETLKASPSCEAATGPQVITKCDSLWCSSSANAEAVQSDRARSPAISAPEPRPALGSALDDLRLEAIVETSDLVASLAIRPAKRLGAVIA